MDRRFTQVEFGSHKVEVIEGGYYDRFRVNFDGKPDLTLRADTRHHAQQALH
jgi:hypothetical protein